MGDFTRNISQSPWPKKNPFQRGNLLYQSPMTSSDNPFLHAKKQWKKVYESVFFQDTGIAKKEPTDPVQNSVDREQHHESPETAEVGSLQDESGKVIDWTGFGDVRRSLLCCLAHA